MKVVHVIKRIEEIDNDIRELRKLEKSVKQNKSFTTPIYMTIEKQINILLGDRIKMLELKIDNPPESMVQEIESEAPEIKPLLTPAGEGKKEKKPKAKKKKAKAEEKIEEEDDDDIMMLTQMDIDSKISSIQKESAKEKKKAPAAKKAVEATKEEKVEEDDESVKLLDIALEKGSLNTKEQTKEKKVRFFRDNFPVD